MQNARATAGVVSKQNARAAAGVLFYSVNIKANITQSPANFIPLSVIARPFNLITIPARREQNPDAAIVTPSDRLRDMGRVP